MRFSGGGRAALAGQRRRESSPAPGDRRFRQPQRQDNRRQADHRWQGGPEVVRRQAQLADVRRQAIFLARRMLDSMRPGQQLAEQQGNNEE